MRGGIASQLECELVTFGSAEDECDEVDDVVIVDAAGGGGGRVGVGAGIWRGGIKGAG
jgi:hypothetical protein